MSLASRLTVDGCRFTTRYSTQSFVIPCSRPSVIVGPRPYDEARRRSLSPYQTLAAACPEFPTVLGFRLADGLPRVKRLRPPAKSLAAMVVGARTGSGRPYGAADFPASPTRISACSDQCLGEETTLTQALSPAASNNAKRRASFWVRNTPPISPSLSSATQ